jgi:hypothetical protein
MSVLALYVDFNARERLPDGGQAVSIHIGRMNPLALENKLEIGSRVILYDEEICCLGVLRLGQWVEGWVADISPGTIKDLLPSEFERLRSETNRAALGLAE